MTGTVRQQLMPLEHIFRALSGIPSAITKDGGQGVNIDVHEEENAFVVKADMPGFNKEDISINVSNKEFSISATRTSVNEERKENGRLIFSERSFGQVSRSFEFPVELDGDNVKASYKDGVLEVILPKKAKSGKTTIKID